MSFKSALEEAGRDRHGVTISHGDDGIDFGVIDFVDNPSWNPTSSINVTVNLTSHANVILNKLRISSMVGRQSSDTIRQCVHFSMRETCVNVNLSLALPGEDALSLNYWNAVNLIRSRSSFPRTDSVGNSKIASNSFSMTLPFASNSQSYVLSAP
jgi:hypothetical protein